MRACNAEEQEDRAQAMLGHVCCGLSQRGFDRRQEDPMRSRIFVGSSREAIDVSRAVQQELDDDFDVTVWDQDVFQLSYGALESLLDALETCDAGLFVLGPDDLTESRGESRPTVRDNVIFELGMFIGRLGRDRAYMLMPAKPQIRLPSDLSGLNIGAYDLDRFQSGQRRAAVGAACTRVRQALKALGPQLAPESRQQARLDRASRRMSQDLEELLAAGRVSADGAGSSLASALPVTFAIARAAVSLEPGRIQDHLPTEPQAAVLLPANEYFDDECITDPSSSLGAFVHHHFEGRAGEFLRQVQAELAGRPSRRVRRTGDRIDDSYGIGEAIFLRGFQPGHRIIVVSATTQRAGIGLHAEPHFLYAALEGAVEVMNERRLNSMTMPVLGSGHGGMPLPSAILFNLLAARSALQHEIGRHMREIRIVVLAKDADKAASPTTRALLSRLAADT